MEKSNATEMHRIGVKDLNILREMNIRTFSDSFGEQNTKENLRAYLEQAFAAEMLRAELSNPCSEFYFATLDKVPVGYIKLNTGDAQTEQKEAYALEIERIYVLKEYQGMRVGKALFDKALQRAHELGVGFIWLGVWEKNEKAIQFYKKLGFKIFGEHEFLLGEDCQTDLLMRLDF